MLLVENDIVRKMRREVVHMENSFGDVLVWRIFVLAKNIRAEIQIDREISGIFMASFIHNMEIFLVVDGEYIRIIGRMEETIRIGGVNSHSVFACA